MLLVMGLGAQLVFWPDDFCRDLADRGFRVIRFDNRDAGHSTRLDALPVPRPGRMIARWVLGRPVPAPYGLEAMADDTMGLLDALGIERAHVVGASLGGMVTQLCAIRHPAKVASLTSIMSHPGDRWSNVPWPHALRALLRPVAKTREEAQDSWVEFLRIAGSPGFRLDEAGIRERAGLHFDRGSSPRGFARQFAAVLAAGDRREALARVTAPALVVHGSADPLVPRRGGIATARALPNAELLLVEGMGHDLPRGAWPTILDGIARTVAAGERAMAAST